MTAAGAAGGVIVSETLHYAAKKQADKAYASGYDKGKSDAVKQQYWLYVSMQRQRNQVSNVRLYPVQLPEQRIDGVTFQPRLSSCGLRVGLGFNVRNEVVLHPPARGAVVGVKPCLDGFLGKLGLNFINLRGDCFCCRCCSRWRC